MEENQDVELREARLRIKKLERQLKQALLMIDRNRVNSESKDSLSRVVSMKKSELETYMNLLLENCPDIIFIFDSDGKLAYCTDVFLKESKTPGFGLVAGQGMEQFLGRYTDKAFLLAAEKLYSPEENASVHLQRSIDFGGRGEFRDYSVQLSPMKGPGGTTVGAMFLFYDATELLKAQREAEKANKAKSDFLATVSHEIRTPMNAIIGLSQMFWSTELSTEQQNYLRNIQNSSHVLLNLINDILDFSKIEAGKLELVNDYFSLPVLLKKIKAMFELLFADKDLSFTCAFAQDIPQVVYGDEKRIGQVITNLLSNSLKYTQTGGVSFRVLPAGDEDSKAGDGLAHIHIEIEDTGIGIKPDALPKLFTPFEQLDLVRNKTVQGTGLGLVITKRLCEMMNGSITVESKYNSGSLFTVHLNVKEGTASDMPREQKAPESFNAPEARVLLVDDIDINLEVAAFILGTYGINPDLARSGREALEKARETDYDLILMDHMMPEMDGVEAAGAIRAMGGWNAGVPIIALTANAVSGAREMFLANGFNGLLAKPMENSLLAEALLKWLPEERIAYKKRIPVPAE